MAKLPEDEDRTTPEQYRETIQRDNPPESSARPAAAVAGMWYVLAPVGMVLLIIVLGTWFMLGGDPLTTDEGRGTDVEATTGDGAAELFGGGDTRDEIEFRGGAGPGSASLTMGQQVTLEDVAVADVREGNAFSIEHRGERLMVEAPQDGPAVRAGMRVDVSGMVEGDDRGGLRIRATQVTPR
jgi:hypothetical protein